MLLFKHCHLEGEEIDDNGDDDNDGDNDGDEEGGDDDASGGGGNLTGDALLQHCTKIIGAYAAAGDRSPRSLPLSVTSQQRKDLHDLCTNLGLWHKSVLDAASGSKCFRFAARRVFVPSSAADGVRVVGRLVSFDVPPPDGSAAVPTRGVVTSYCTAAHPVPAFWRVDFECGHSAPFSIDAIQAGEKRRWE